MISDKDNGQVLVAYATKGGVTEEYSSIVAGILIANGFQVEQVDLRRNKRPEISDHDIVILGTGVRMGRVYGRGKKLLGQEALKNKKLVIFLSSGIAIEDPEQARQKFLLPLIEKYGLQPLDYRAFPGRMPEPGGNKDKKKDTSDPEMVKKWAKDLVEKLK